MMAVPATLEPQGKGFSADDLHAAQLAALKKRLDEEHPKLHAEAVQVVAAEIRARDAVTALKADVVTKVGAENARESMILITRDAEAIVAAERARGRLSGNAPMAGNAASLPQPRAS